MVGCHDNKSDSSPFKNINGKRRIASQTMSDAKKKPFTPPVPKVTTNKTKRASTSAAPPSRVLQPPRVPQSVMKDRLAASRAKVKQNTTILADGDTTLAGLDPSLPEYEEFNRSAAYGKFLGALLQDCLLEEKIAREETDMDVQMTHLANRMQATVELLDKTSKRVKEVTFAVEQKRLLDLKQQDCVKFQELSEQSNTDAMLQHLKNLEQSSLDQLQTVNVDFGFNKLTGHQQLTEAVTDAIHGLDEIKKHSDLDLNKFKEYESCKTTLEDLDKERMDFESLKRNFEKKFPNYSERLLKQISDTVAKIADSDLDDEED